MKYFILISLFISSSYALVIEGRLYESKDKCHVLVNENELSNSFKAPVECEVFLVDKYKYKLEVDETKCPFKVKKVSVLLPGVQAKSFDNVNSLKKCSSKK